MSDEPELENWQSAEETQNTGFRTYLSGPFPHRPAIRFLFSLSPDTSPFSSGGCSSLVTHHFSLLLMSTV